MNPTGRVKRSPVEEFLHSESAGGIILMVAAAAALVVANAPLAPVYFRALHARIAGLPVLDWINEALMALFFLLVGLEIKRELVCGHLSSWGRRALPGIAAAGGVVVPALIFGAINSGPAGAPRGWAIPSATDIAFALGVLTLLGSRVPPSLKLMLTALAIIDDLIAITIIAVFYTDDLALVPLALAGATLVVLLAINLAGVTRLLPYLALGAALWVFVFRSGVHATLAGAALGLLIPLDKAKSDDVGGLSPLHRLERGLHPWVAFGVVPLFGFANAGISFAGLTPGILSSPVPLGIAAGLFLGKQAGVLSFSWAAIRLKIAEFPAGATWRSLYGLTLLCGIGFTMSLFIGVLAFEEDILRDQTKIGVLAGSLLSGLAGWAMLRSARPSSGA